MTRNQWEEIPPMPANCYHGATRLIRDGRHFACVGIGEEVRKALREKAAKPRPAPYRAIEL